LITTNDPVKIAEDFSVLQHLSGGRTDVMLGRGSIAERFAAFGRIGSTQDEIERLCIWGSDDPPFEEDSPNSRQDAIYHWGGDRGGHRGVEVRRGHHDDVEVEKLVEAAVSAGAVVRCGGEPKTRCTA
jgi:hypothetical protein